MAAVLRTAVCAAVVAGLAWGAPALHGHPYHGRDASFSLVVGALLQRSRLCFAGAFRDLFLARDRRLALALLAALAAGSAGYLVVFGAGMVLAGGCISGHLFRLGEGSGTSLVALAATLPGFALGSASWNGLYLNEVATAPVVWLPEHVGYAGATAVQLGTLALLAALLLWRLPGLPRTAAAPLGVGGAWRRVARDPWPAWVGGAGLGVLGTFAFLRIEPLGVTSQLSLLTRTFGARAGLLPARLEGLDTLRGGRPAASELLLTQNRLLVGGLVLGSLAAAVLAGEFRPRLGRPAALARGALGGLLLGAQRWWPWAARWAPCCRGRWRCPCRAGPSGRAWFRVRSSASGCSDGSNASAAHGSQPLPPLRRNSTFAGNPAGCRVCAWSASWRRTPAPGPSRFSATTARCSTPWRPWRRGTAAGCASNAARTASGARSSSARRPAPTHPGRRPGTRPGAAWPGRW